MSSYAVCEFELDIPDPKEPNMSMVEIDIYGSVPYVTKSNNPTLKDHRLTLRKNLHTKEYFAFEHYLGLNRNLPDKVVYSSTNLQDVLNFIDNRWKEYWGPAFPDSNNEGHVPCSHGENYNSTSSLCPKVREYNQYRNCDICGDQISRGSMQKHKDEYH